jgi:hypothetical protein
MPTGNFCDIFFEISFGYGVHRRDVDLFDERVVEKMEELADFIRVHAVVNVLAGSRETRLEVSKRRVEATQGFL